MTTDIYHAEYRTIKGKRMVVLSESDFQELLMKADLAEPSLPPADADGNRPAVEYAAVSIARSILRARRRLGMTQAYLARLAGIRPETLNRIEQGRNEPSVPTIAKIERALLAAGREKKESCEQKTLPPS